MAMVDKTFQDLTTQIITDGYWYNDPYRKGVKRKELATYTFKHDLTKEFPAMTTKSLYWKGVVGELIWFLRGETSPKYLIDNNINIWNKDGANFLNKQTGDNLSEAEYKRLIKQDQLVGDLGRIYGAQWREYRGVGDVIPFGTAVGLVSVDQISRLIKGMISRPLATDLVVTAWNPTELDKMALPPCHFGFQVVGRPLTLQEKITWGVNNRDLPVGDITITQEDLSERTPQYGFTLVWDQRSVDTFLGLPFNIASYALLAHILGKVTNMVPLEIVGNLRNVHIYDNAMDAIKEQLIRDDTKFKGAKLTIKYRPEYDRLLKDRCSLDNFLSNLEISDFNLDSYESYPPLKVEMLARD